MAGNLQADNSGNILVEFDYNNLIVVDPNKTIDAFGNIQERLIDHENLVMFANLEAELIPRTKLAVGASFEDRQRTISVAKMNFLKPSKNTYLGTGYYDELTGDNTTQFKGENQMSSRVATSPNGGTPYVVDEPVDLKNVIDNGLLGITSINITTNSSYIPTVEILLEDVQGKALFQLGNNSPYAAFFNLPYPPFYLTLKGYYGQAIRYQLNLKTFHASFNGFSGNYLVRLQFEGYKFNILNEIAMGHLLAAPHMYSQRFNITQTPDGPQQSNKSAESQASTQAEKGANSVGSKDAIVTQLVTERGYQKIVEVYSEYKSKGLIPPDFPELTVVQLMNKLDQFEQNIMNSFDKTEVQSLTNIRNYKGILTQYFDNIRGASTSWFNTYLDPKPIVLKNGQKEYVFKELSQDIKTAAISKLESNINDYNKALSENPTLGNNGTAKIVNPIKVEMIMVDPPQPTDIDWVETTRLQTGIVIPTDEDIRKITKKYSDLMVPVLEVVDVNGKKSINPVKTKWFIFEGDGRFDKQINLLEVEANKKLSQFETEISASLLRKIENTATGIGFKPTVRNMTAVIMASAEGFIRLLDDVHTNAWNVKYDPVRRRAIMDNPSSAKGSDTSDNLKISAQAQSENQGLSTSIEPVYPWPQFFVETPEDKKGRFQLKYIADPTVVNLTQGYLYDKWPEVEFVEEYMKGLTQKFQNPTSPPPLDNQRDTNTININAIEFPSEGLAYTNKEEVKFFYEIWERQFVTSHYSGLVRANSQQIDELIRLNIESEVNNIVSQINVSSPYLALKLKNFDLKSSNYEGFLSNISNMGTGRAYQDFIRDFFVTPYIKNLTENSFGILNILDIGKIPQVSTNSDALRSLLNNSSNRPLIVDTIPYTDQSWCLNNLNDSNTSMANEVYNTKKSLTIFEPRKIIANFTDVYDYKTNRPVTNFSYLLNQNPTTLLNPNSQVISNVGLAAFYNTRTPNDFVATEGYVDGTTPTGELGSRTTTSILNTPYFVNAIQNGVYNSRISGNTYPYVQAAFLFLNSLPLATLREKNKTISNDVVSDLDYVSSMLKKFGAIHKLPYAWMLRYGSIWHRYKKFKETGVDILQSAWSNFNYVGNYSPILSSTTQTYSLKYGNENTTITLQSETDTDVNMQIGFYPKLINDFNVFYNGYDLYKDYSDEEIQNSINGGLKLFNFVSSNITNAKQGDKNLRLTTLSVLLPNITPDSSVDCNPKDNTVGDEYFVIPSFGTTFNQTQNTCILNQNTIPTTKVNLTNNPNVFNGSVRCLWSAPNYGYFDNNQITYPQPDSYLNFIVTNGTQSPMHLLTEDGYTKIEEIFSVFDKKVLDRFEDEFLNFCKPITNASTTIDVASFGIPPVSTDTNYRNFQSLFKSLMAVPVKTNTQTDDQYFTNTINSQYNVFQNGIKNFMEYDIIFKYGNPSNYNRRIFDSYLSHNSTPVVVDPISFNPYVSNSLPKKGGTTSLSQSQINNREAWRALETEVGFSTIPNVVYSSTGSYITDFFIDNNIEFTAQNVVLLSPLVKMYATQKLIQPTITAAQFKSQLTSYLNRETDIQNDFLNGVLSGVRAALPNQQQLPESTINSVISGEQSKVENYEMFKALNDKWVAGGDYKNKTLFEDMLFLDRASRNIGETILIDIFAFRDMFSEKSLNQAMSVFTFISGMLIKNNFTVMNLPGYVNFYNVQDVDGTTLPRPEGSLAFANNLWGSFLDVDYRNSGPKIVCFYVGKPSQYLDLPKGNFRFRDDAFEMRRASENPLLEDQQGKTDWAMSNKCVGFNVDLGIRNQNIFYSFTVSQDSGVATSEAINTQLNMVNQASGRAVATQNVSLYNLYKNRSYKCTVTSLGNALIQPTMYFNLRHVPMFNGPYMITDVSHSIQPGNFQTVFNGIRQGVYDLPSIDNFLQSINQNLITKLEEILKINKEQVVVTGTTNSVKSNNVVQGADNTLDTTNSCSAKVAVPVYSNYISVNGTLTKVTPKDFAAALKRLLPNNPNLQTIIYAISYIRTFQTDSNSKVGSFNGWDNNLGTISLDMDWGASSTKFQTQYSCINIRTNPSTSSSTPIVHFATLDDYINFMVGRLMNNVDRILDIGLTKYYVCYWPKSNVSPEYYDNHIGDYTKVKTSFYNALASAVDVGLINVDGSIKFKNKIKNTDNSGKTPNVTPTPSPIPQTVGQICPPPVVNTFSPSAGYTGTIIQINGRNFESVKSIKVIDKFVDLKDITILNDQTIRFVLPAITIPEGKQVASGKIFVTNEYGTFETIATFTFNPSLQNVITSSPGGYQNTETQQQSSVAQQNTEGANLNPQNTGPLTMIGTTVQLNESKTQSLNVKINPQLTGYVLTPNPDMKYVVYELVEENGKVIRKWVSQNTIGVGGQISNNEFNITLNEVESYLTNNIPKIEGKTQIDITFILKAYKGQEVSVPQQFPFKLWYTLPNQSQVPVDNIPVNQTLPTFPPQQIKLISLGESSVLQGNGFDYYNIKKPGGGYITYQLMTENPFESQYVVNTRVLNGVTYNNVSFSSNGGADTKYTNLVEINSLGDFRLQVQYKPYGNTSPNGGEILTQTILSDIFTL